MRIAVLAMLLACCAAPPRAATYTPRGVGGDIVAPASAKGRLVVGWMTAAEAKDGITLGTIRNMIERFVVASDDTDFRKTPRVPYFVPNVPPDAVPFVVLDVDHGFWPTFAGDGHGLVGQAKPGGGTVTLAANPPRTRTKCEGPRYRSIVVEQEYDGPGSPARRLFCAWLPKTFQDDRTYPVVFLLPGFMSNEMAYLGPNGLGPKLDAMNGDAVLVGVDTSSKSGSSYLPDDSDEPYGTILSAKALEEIETAVHGRFRRSSRALIGQSTGGFNALSFGMRHSDQFSVIGASSPDSPDVEAFYLTPGTRTVKPWLHAWLRLEHRLGGPGQLTSWAHAWSADAWPFNLENGRAYETVLAKWIAASPRAMLDDEATVQRLKTDLSGRILITVGRGDQFELFAPAEGFAKRLNAAGIDTTFVPTDDGHENGMARLEAAVRFALERLD